VRAKRFSGNYDLFDHFCSKKAKRFNIWLNTKHKKPFCTHLPRDALTDADTLPDAKGGSGNPTFKVSKGLDTSDGLWTESQYWSKAYFRIAAQSMRSLTLLTPRSRAHIEIHQSAFQSRPALETFRDQHASAKSSAKTKRTKLPPPNSTVKVASKRSGIEGF